MKATILGTPTCKRCGRASSRSLQHKHKESFQNPRGSGAVSAKSARKRMAKVSAAVANAIGYGMHRSRSHDAVIRVTMRGDHVIVRPMPVMKKLFALGLLVIATPGWSQPVPGSLDVHWNEGAPDCTATPQDPLQVHSYDPQTFILRQSPCASFEANFLYLLVGSDKALLIDTGAVADPKKMPVAKAILELLPDQDHQKLPLLVAHTHRHLDHRAGDPQFASLPSVQVVPID